MEWGIYALIASLAYATVPEINRHFKLDGLRLNFWRSSFSALILLPFFPLMEWPAISNFYVVVTMVAAVSVVGLMVQFNLAAKHNGRVASMVMPVKTFTIFIMWLIWDEATRTELFTNPLKSAGILVCFIAFMIALQFIRRNDNGWRAFLIILPISILYSFSDTFSKIILEEAVQLMPMVLTFIFVSNIITALLSLAVITGLNDSDKPLKPKGMLKGAAFIAVTHTLSWYCFAVALVLSPNPAYPSVISMLIPVWLMIYYKIIGVEDNASPKAGLAMLVSAVGLILVSTW